MSDGWLSPQQIKTLRKEIDDRRRRKRLAYKRLRDGELAGGYDQATLDAADAALASSEFFEAGGPEKLNVKAWPAVAFALAESCDAMVVQLKKKKCVLYRPLPPGTPGAVVLRTTGKQIPWKARSPASATARGASWDGRRTSRTRRTRRTRRRRESIFRAAAGTKEE